MATFNKPCIHCGQFIAGDARYCQKCGSRTPFGYQCPTCLRSVEKTDMLCDACGRSLQITCPKCKQQTFVGDKCDACGISLMIQCQNPRCGEMQFFENVKCTACGKKIKKK